MADKYIAIVNGIRTEVEGTVVSAGAADAGKIVALNASGKLDDSVMPAGIGADNASVLTSEALAAGDLVNIYNNAGTANARKADASTVGKEAHGFVKQAYGSGVLAVIYAEGNNDQVTGLTPGRQYLSTTPGLSTHTPPSASGNVVQPVGVATAAANLSFEADDPTVLA